MHENDTSRSLRLGQDLLKPEGYDENATLKRVGKSVYLLNRYDGVDGKSLAISIAVIIKEGHQVRPDDIFMTDPVVINGAPTHRSAIILPKIGQTVLT